VYLVTVASNIADYWLTDAEAVTVTYTNLAGTGTTATAKAKRSELGYREMQMGGPVGIEPTDAVWIVGSATIGALTFERGGTITYGGVVWTILNFRALLVQGTVTAYRAICRERAT